MMAGKRVTVITNGAVSEFLNLVENPCDSNVEPTAQRAFGGTSVAGKARARRNLTE
jgi:hypothetical protein